MTVKNRHATKQLLALARAENNKCLAVRIQAVALAKQGFTCPHIVQMTGYSRRAVQRWIARYNQAGIKGLIDKPDRDVPQNCLLINSSNSVSGWMPVPLILRPHCTAGTFNRFSKKIFV